MKSETRQILVIAVLVTAATLLASFGFQSLSDNPLAPDGVEVTVEDAPNDDVLSSTGSGRILSVTHTGSEPVPLSELEVVISDVPFNQSNDWTLDGRQLLLELYLNDVRLRNVSDNRTFAPGDTLWLTKTTESKIGRVDTLRVQIVHQPSRRVIAEGSADVE